MVGAPTLEKFLELKSQAQIDSFERLESYCRNPDMVHDFTLGELFELVRLEDETVDRLLTVEGDYIDPRAWSAMQSRGFTGNMPATFLQSDEAELITRLGTFTHKWVTTHPGEVKPWNPPYASALIQLPRSAEYLSKDTRSYQKLFAKLDIGTIDDDSLAVFPLNGWGLAQCVRYHHEGKMQTFRR